MHVTIDRESWVPVYLQIAQQIRIMILEGSLSRGMPLPTLCDLASVLGVNRKTVIRAYRVLRSEGLIKGCGRRGTMVRTSIRACADVLRAHTDLHTFGTLAPCSSGSRPLVHPFGHSLSAG